MKGPPSGGPSIPFQLPRFDYSPFKVQTKKEYLIASILSWSCLDDRGKIEVGPRLIEDFYSIRKYC
jgi:hypothetical protein